MHAPGLEVVPVTPEAVAPPESPGEAEELLGGPLKTLLSSGLWRNVLRVLPPGLAEHLVRWRQA
ncbi:MAG: hypothetical protein J2P48_08705 [Alphaproteobacteria bacterium]|nr:hypothetical protein [Alphaproteobacteria bacterium]